MRKRPLIVALTAVLVVVAVVLAGTLIFGWGRTDPNSLGAVKVGGTTKKPTVTVKKGFTAKKTSSKVVTAGSGAKVKKNDIVMLNYIAVNGRTGKTFVNTFTTNTPQSMTLSSSSALPGFITGLVGQKTGSRVLTAMAPKDATALISQTSTLGLKKTDTLVFLFDVKSVVPRKASGTAQKLPANVPQITYSKAGVPTGFKKTATSPTSVSKASAHVAILGKGSKVKKGQSITAQYVGATLKNLKVFQTSWGSSPLTSTIGESSLIKCWDQLIPGQTVGSRIVVECPASLAYGNKASTAGTPTGDLIFVLDILAAS